MDIFSRIFKWEKKDMSKSLSNSPLVPFNPAAFRMKFKAFFACFMFTGAMLFISIALFTDIGQKAKEAGPIIGFLTGTLLTTIVAYYFTNTDETKAAQIQPLEKVIDSVPLPNNDQQETLTK